MYVRLTSVTDKSKRQHFGLFFSLFLTKNRKLAGAQSAPALNWHWSGSVIGLYCCCCCCCLSVVCWLLFFLYFYFIDIGRFFFSTEPNRPNLPLSTCLACLPFISCNCRFNLPTSSTAYRIYIEKKYLNMHTVDQSNQHYPIYITKCLGLSPG